MFSRFLDTDEVRSSEISIFCGENDILNSNEDYIQFDVSSARSSINIVKIPEFKVSSVYAVSGETVKVDVSIENNPGIFSVAFNPVYDETVLEFTGVDYNFELFPGGTLTGNAQNGEEFKIWGIFNRFDGCEKNCENGVFMTLNFRVLDTAKSRSDRGFIIVICAGISRSGKCKLQCRAGNGKDCRSSVRHKRRWKG